jgi:outer membrane protein
MRLIRVLLAVLTILILAAPPASAADLKIATVDLNRAINEVEDGKQAKVNLEKIYEGKAAELAQMEQSIMALQEEYRSKEPMLSQTAKEEFAQRIYQAQGEYQQAMMVADQSMQAAQMQAMDQLFAKMKTIAGAIAGEKGYDLVLESSQGIVVYADPSMDITDAVIARYNQAQ